MQGEMAKDGDADDHVTPVEIGGITNATAIYGGIGHLCAILPDKTAKCWGTNSNGELGHGQPSNNELPGTVNGLPAGVAQLAFGADHGCARMDDGALYCWGSNKLGQLGDGTKESRLSPKRVRF
jgi:alpha-tubulin suppressor-like RCC1 family protein